MATEALVRNAVTVAGGGVDTLVLGHGFGADQRSFARLVAHFASRYCVVSFDLTGAGRSVQSAYDLGKYGTLEGHAEDLVEIGRELELERALYVGHSAGGMIGTLAAIRAPRMFRKLALISASPRYIDEPGYVGGMPRADVDHLIGALARDYVAWCNRVVPVALGEPARSPLVRDVTSSFQRLDPKIAHHLAKTIFYSDYRSVLPQLESETLVIQPAVDPFVPVSVGVYIAEQVRRGRLAQVNARGGHFPHLGAPTEIGHLIEGFFRDAYDPPRK